MAITPKALFDYACEYAAKAEADGKGASYPTFREAAKRFNVTNAQIDQAIEDWDQSNGYMQPAVGVRVGSGIAEYKHRGECLVEAYV
jgi:hypothetical protein